jgi:hypothetical protein
MTRRQSAFVALWSLVSALDAAHGAASAGSILGKNL